jgi:acyl carrier protein
MDPRLSSLIARREEMLGRVRRILIERLRVPREPDEIDPDVSLFGTGLGLDSVDAVELLVSLESELGVKLPPEGNARRAMRTVNTLVDLALGADHAC